MTPTPKMIASWPMVRTLAGLVVRTLAGAATLALVAVLAGTAAAQPSAQPGAQPGGAAAPAEPAAPPPAVADPGGDARKACSTAMNADPKFAAEIVRIADERAQLQRDTDTLKAHQDANHHVQRNERHVIYAYAAMWIIAAGFVVFLWRRQRVLEAEIEHLRRDLDAADTGGKAST
jgi:CcmD family protein